MGKVSLGMHKNVLLRENFRRPEHRTLSRRFLADGLQLDDVRLLPHGMDMPCRSSDRSPNHKSLAVDRGRRRLSVSSSVRWPMQVLQTVIVLLSASIAFTKRGRPSYSAKGCPKAKSAFSCTVP
jgi:hypothetical protein